MYIGIDMGTSSVGMAVTDENYNLYRVKERTSGLQGYLRKPVLSLIEGQTG